MGRPREHVVISRLPKDGIGAEIGVNKGEFSASLLKIAQPRQLHLIDPWKQYEPFVELTTQDHIDRVAASVLKKFATEIADGTVVIHRAMSEEILSGFADGYLDWIYIDGDHRYEFAKQDLELAMRKVKPGGIIAGDDYDHPKLKAKGWGEVKKAVDEVLATKRVSLVTIESYQYVLING
jgi:predicted O-methyltransferase YrrM